MHSEVLWRKHLHGLYRDREKASPIQLCAFHWANLVPDSGMNDQGQLLEGALGGND